MLLAGVELADHGASILLGALGELDQGSTNFHQITFGPEHPRDAATPRRRHFNHGLIGLNRAKRLFRNHVIPLLPMPSPDLGLFETFATIGQPELRHRFGSPAL